MRFPNRGKINNQETNHDGLTQPVKGWVEIDIGK